MAPDMIADLPEEPCFWPIRAKTPMRNAWR